jgi:hypothetical protein
MISIVPGISIFTAFAEEVKTKKVPALRNKVYAQLARAQKLADDGKVADGLAALDDIKRKSGSMNDYEVAMMHNFYGFIYYNQNDLPKAINAFELVVEQNNIPESLKLSTLFSLAQLAMAQNQYSEVVNYLTRWDEINIKPKTDSYYVLKSQALYQDKQFQMSLDNISLAIDLAETDNKIPKENWLVLQRALFYALNQTDKVTIVLEKMVKLYNKPKYWLQLGNMYGELGEEAKQLAILESAKQQGFITKKSDIRNMAQVYLFNGLAFKAAQMMQNGLDTGVVDSNDKNFAFVAESFMQAKEDEQAILFFKKASKISKIGKYDQRLAELYLNNELFEEAADSARLALDKGLAEGESNSYIALGMAQYNLENFDASILAFEQAKEHIKARKLASQWLKFVKREQLNAQTLKTAYL